MQEYKILELIEDLEAKTAEPIQRVDGLTRNPKDIIRTIEYYTNNRYLSGNKDELEREKPFYNICNFRVTTAKTATDLDLKDIKYEADSLKYSVQAMLINHELYKYLKEIDFSKTLNDMGATRPRYGGVLIKKTNEDIDVVEWVNLDFDPNDVLGGTLVETHYLKPSELAKKTWEGYDSIDDVLEEHEKISKNKPQDIEIKEITGEFSESYDPDIEDTDTSRRNFKKMCFYVACLDEKKFLLYKEDLKSNEDKYKYLPWEEMGKGLGRGIVEEGFEAQVWVNDSVISIKNAMDLTGKTVLATDSQKIKGNVITGVDTGHIFELEPGRTITSINLAPTSLPEMHNMIELWQQQYDRTSSTYDANTGEAPTAGTPYSQTALLNQVANSPFEYQREVWGIWLNEVLNDWILPTLKKRIKKDHYLVSEFDDDELEVIDNAIAEYNGRQAVINAIRAGRVPTYEEYQAAKAFSMQSRPGGSKRELKIPEGFLDVEGHLTANITGELKNKAAIMQSLDGILKTIISTFNPQTGTYAALEDKKLATIFGTIVEMAGVPFSFKQLQGQTGQPAPMGAPMGAAPDLSAINPVAPQK